MAEVDTFHTALVEELADLLDAEEQLTQTLPRLAEAASAAPLKRAIQKHLKETEGHVERLKRAMQELGEEPESKTCKGMKGLLEEGDHHVKNAPAGPLRDAVLIVGAQKVEHYEMASYGSARTFAQVLGHTRVARLLEQTLNEEKAADQKLTQIAEGGVNESAAQHWSESQEAREGLMERVTGTIGTASRQVMSTARRMAASAASRTRGTRRSAGRRTARSASSSNRRKGGRKK
jgi:ferritin-like metal-binding protein YciE